MSKQYEAGLPGKIAQGSEGLGTVTPDMVEERARELAKADGRPEPNEKDLFEARQELLPSGEDATAPELDDSSLESITEWDTAPESTGSQAPKLEPYDDDNIAEQLVEEGIAEADHDQRVTAAEENPPEEV